MGASLLLALWAAVVGGLEVLPERSRHGRLADLVPSWKEEGTVKGAAVQSVFDAPLDHFNQSVQGTIPIRYWYDKTCFQEGGPIFVRMGGEGMAGPSTCGDRERKHKAMALSVEHRFYGFSIPKADAPYSVDFLRYLTVEQNLADTAAIVEHVQKTVGGKVVFAFGGSYSGATCAWFRLKYPDLVTGCLSSSGVVHAMYEMPEFDTRVAKAISHPDTDCPARLRNATLALERAFAKGESEKARVKKLFNADNLIGTKLGDSDFFYAVADGTAQMDQYGQKAALCSALAKVGANPTDEERIQNVADVIKTHYGERFVAGCFYDSECLKNDKGHGSIGVGNRSWRWQKCRELAYLQNAPAQGSLRSTKYLTMEALTEQCNYVFGLTPAEIEASVKKFNSKYYQPLADASKIMFLDFSDDPWQEASVKKALNPELPYCMTTCDGCGHCGSGAGQHSEKCDAEADAYIDKWVADALNTL